MCSIYKNYVSSINKVVILYPFIMCSMMRLVFMSLPDCAQLILFAGTHTDILRLLSGVLFTFLYLRLFSVLSDCVVLSVCLSVSLLHIFLCE